ncbi:uncharacterized protein LOC132699593 [Cylas formicarius]|uniref:uncharacterized protein LOC132699593 n=1 Tax=Cylas formicarius TaxID=197179 RepID=UPI002958CFF7|nr:uncharacterized protein LOC132699593 [Cylas formicarius]
MSGAKAEPYQKPDPHDTPTLLLTSLWLFSAINSAAKVEFFTNMTGVAVTFNMQDVLLIAFTSWMLHRGLSTRNVALIVPWLVFTLYGIYYNQYKSLVQMLSILRSIRHVSSLAWIAIGISFLGLVLRAILAVRTLQLSTNLWYRKKLEKELLN